MVRVTTLDLEVDEDVYVLKVDVQGWEPHVFAGAVGLLQKHEVQLIVFELSPYTLCEGAKVYRGRLSAALRTAAHRSNPIVSPLSLVIIVV